MVRKPLSEDRALARITASFALLSLLLAAAGLFALISELALSRLREFGIRSALGASAARVMVTVLRDSVAVVGTGTLLGVPLALGVGALLGSRRVGVGSADLSTFGVATPVLFLVATLASLPVAVRAGRIDPARVLMAD